MSQNDTNLKKEESLICEALVREIAKANRWSAVVEAWYALLRVRLMAKDLTHNPSLNLTSRPKDGLSSS